MKWTTDETIAALASAPGSGPRGLIRLSGSQVRSILQTCFTPSDTERWENLRRADRCVGHLNLEGRTVPISVEVQFWPGRRSYTGEPVAELHLTGSPPVLEAVLAEVLRRGARAAKPGEFTLRAFLAGKLDLVQAEAVLGVIDARDPLELKTALGQLAGQVSHQLVHMRADLIDLLADLEAGLDFIEEDIEFVGRPEIAQRLSHARQKLQSLQQQAGERLQSRPWKRVVLAGLPNAGKSTFFNFLVGKPLAIVSSEQGTTRDILTARLELQGVTVELIDTAGWEIPANQLTKAAQTHRMREIEQADLVIWCTAADLDADAASHNHQRRDETALQAAEFIEITTKADLTEERRLSPNSPMAVSAQTGAGFAPLQAIIVQKLSEESTARRQWLGVTAARCQSSLHHAIQSLSNAESLALTANTDDELLAIDVREALHHLGEIVGEVYTDDLLDRIFSKFCIGK